ncbi:hypothetical protein PM082_002309 [Marasmius tenuissimus]|nr:hypothetical protein PM082_002309 [Marasmius tenuissimus]
MATGGIVPHTLIVFICPGDGLSCDTIQQPAYTRASTRDGRVIYRKNGKFISRFEIPREILSALDISPLSPPDSPSPNPVEELSPRAAARRDLFDSSFNTCLSRPSSPSPSPVPPPNMSEGEQSPNPSGSGEPDLSPAQMMKAMMQAFERQSQTISELTALVRTPATATPPASVPAPTVPAFIAAPAPLSKSLFDAFPFITDQNILLDVTRHELKPFDIRKLDSKLRAKADNNGSLSTFDSRTSSNRDYPTLASLMRPLGIYFQILLFFASSGGQIDVVTALSMGMVKYMVHLSDLNQRFEWEAVWLYHMDYHALRRRKMMNGDYTGWGMPDSNLTTEYLFGQDQKLRAAATQPAALSAHAKTAKRLPIEQQTCYVYNSGSCSSNPCNRIHQCSVCQSKDHIKSSCPKSTKK